VAVARHALTLRSKGHAVIKYVAGVGCMSIGLLRFPSSYVTPGSGAKYCDEYVGLSVRINGQETQLLLGWPTVLPHNLNPNPKPITN